MESEGTTSEPQELPEDIQALGYEEARDQLFSIVQTLERNQSGLEESIALWERSSASRMYPKKALRRTNARNEASHACARLDVTVL